MEHQPHIEPVDDEVDHAAAFAPLCKSIIAARAFWAVTFGSLCSDPGSEMLLDLYWRDSQGLKTSLTSLWHASKASEMTARRCLAVMEEQAIVERMPDPTDGRRTYVRLTAAGRQKMDACFSALLTGYAETCPACTGYGTALPLSIAPGAPSRIPPCVVTADFSRGRRAP